MQLKRPAAPRGFTLLELGLVIGIISVLSAALLPSVLEAARTRMATRAAEEVRLIQEAARFYYLNPTNAAQGSVWPGQTNNTVCAQTKEPIQELFDRGALQRSAPDPANPAAAPMMRNPWNQPYVTRLVSPLAGGTVDGCMVQVSTWVQRNVSAAFADAVQGACDNTCGVAPPAPPGEFDWCCVFTERPAGISSPGCPTGQVLKSGPGGSVVCGF